MDDPFVASARTAAAATLAAIAGNTPGPSSGASLAATARQAVPNGGHGGEAHTLSAQPKLALSPGRKAPPVGASPLADLFSTSKPVGIPARASTSDTATCAPVFSRSPASVSRVSESPDSDMHQKAILSSSGELTPLLTLATTGAQESLLEPGRRPIHGRSTPLRSQPPQQRPPRSLPL